MITTLLIANRGEIARRIHRTAKAMGLNTVAVYSEADSHALHVKECDQAVALPGTSAADTYLNIERIIQAAKATGAQAVHPGYGFLSENAAFAQACTDAGLVFVGPSVHAIRVMGSKSEAKACVQAAGVPLIPGYFGADQTLDTLLREAQTIGFPLMIKAVAGGGGKGIRCVNNADELPQALASCQREAANAFGDATVMLEKQIVGPRHVEVQVFGDTHGNVVHVFERDCSAQRRHQKVIEEAPAHGLSPQLRLALGETAVKVAKAVNYVGAGTVEFLLDASGAFYFMEMNTRLQVEHPVTEMIAGHDLVEWQLRIAQGQALPVKQADIRIEGHALEARLYAENPDQGFLPAIGQVAVWEAPQATHFTHQRSGKAPMVRLDGAMQSGLSVTPFYDPMVGKLIVWAPDRAQAVSLMTQALGEIRCVGVKNNIAWLRRLCRHPGFLDGGYDTRLIDTMSPEQARASLSPTLCAAAAGLARWARHTHESASLNTSDPMTFADGFASSVPLMRVDAWQQQDDTFTVRSHVRASGARYEQLSVTGTVQGPNASTPQPFAHDVLDCRVRAQSGLIRIEAQLMDNKQPVPLDLFWQGDLLWLHAQGEAAQWLWLNPAHLKADSGHDGQGVRAPMPGKVFAVHVKPGDVVRKGQALVGLEAMKMEHTLNAPRDGVVKAVAHQVGEQVSEGTELVELTNDE